MKKRDISNGEIDRTTKTKIESKRRKPYHSPRLVVYGDLSRVTRGGGGTSKDPGAGWSKI